METKIGVASSIMALTASLCPDVILPPLPRSSHSVYRAGQCRSGTRFLPSDAQRAEHRKVMNGCCNSIAGHLEKVKSFDADDDTIKLIKEQVKNLVEERDAHASWEMRAVYVYKASADVCDQIRDTALRAARDHEASAPLVEHGLVDAVLPVLKSWPCPVWDDDKGVMTVE